MLGVFKIFAGLVASEERVRVLSHEHNDDSRGSPALLPSQVDHHAF